jgi:hypothetical protein
MNIDFIKELGYNIHQLCGLGQSGADAAPSSVYYRGNSIAVDAGNAGLNEIFKNMQRWFFGSLLQ